MLYNYDNIIQIIVLLLCTFYALTNASRHQSKRWTLLALFYGSWLMDDLFWLLYWVFYGTTPVLGVASNLCWYVAYVFLYLLIRQVSPPDTIFETRKLPWLGPVFTFAMAVFYIQWGDVLNNLIYSGLMGILLYAVIRRLMDSDRDQKEWLLLAASLIICVLEYGLWTASCFWKEDSVNNPYYWFDLLITFSFILFIPATRRTVTK